ncbi:MAG: ABC transporter ATP-binding protein [bacterium]|nr:ABC transporter ATP-binding protein [bacterium]
MAERRQCMQKKDNRFTNVLRLLTTAFGSYYPQLILIVVLGFFASLLEGLGISAIIPLFSFVTGGGGFASDTVTKVFSTIFAFVGLPYTFRYLLFFVGVLFVVRILALFAIQNVTARIIFGYERDMRERMFNATVNSNWPFLSMQKVGHLDQLLITNTTTSSQFFGMFSTAVLIITKTIAYIIIALNISHIIALLSFAVGAVLFFILQPMFRLNKKSSTEAESLNRRLAHFVSQHISGMKSVKSAGVEEALSKESASYFDSIRKMHVNIVTIRGFLEMGIQFTGLAFVAGVFAYMYRMPGFNFASFAVIVYAVNQIFMQIQTAQVQLHALSGMIPYLSRANTYQNDAEANAELIGGTNFTTITEGIEFQNVSFSYPGRGEVLSNVSFSVKQGQIVAIVGPSGVGKSTVADLLLRLIEPTTGLVLADGKDVRTISLTEWRRILGYIPQDPFLLNDSIRNNIAFYNPDLSLPGIIDSAKRANIHEFIESLPNGYDTHIGDRGVLVSGGQRQRIVLARLLARNPKVLILDEATSALDPESERAIIQSIENLRGEVTVFIIAHGGEMQSSADVAITLSGGRVATIANSSSARG